MDILSLKTKEGREKFWEEQTRKLWEEIQWEHVNARCFVCNRSQAEIDAGREGYYGEVSPTKDGLQYVCSEHKAQDTSRKEFDVADFIKSLKYHAKINNHPPMTDEACYKHIAQWHSDPDRYHLVNMPDAFKQYLKKHGYGQALQPRVTQQSLW